MGQIRPDGTSDVDSQPSVTKNILFKTSGLLLGGRRRGLGGMAGHKEAMWLQRDKEAIAIIWGREKVFVMWMLG
jgi:hypothetical protein